MLNLECLAAKYGDCLILHYGTEDRPRRILIDGGPPGVYKRHLRRRLKELREEAGDGKPVTFELAMVSHIDEDHIKGLLDLTDEMIETEGTSLDPAEIKRFWHNSFSDITGSSETASLIAASTAIVASADAGGQVPFENLVGSDGRAEHILAGLGQGRNLRSNLDKLGLDGNQPFDAMVLEGKTATLPGGMKLTVVGPNKARLADLQHEWNPSLSPLEIAALTDTSVANLSSIVVMAESGGKRILLTGDARGDDILEGLGNTGFIVDGVCRVDVLKVPHHGSNRNVDEDFFRKVPADTYVLSGDGKHDNPDHDTITMIRNARNGETYTVVLTNEIEMEHPENQKPFDDELEALRAAGISVEIRDPDEHSITVAL